MPSMTRRRAICVRSTGTCNIVVSGAAAVGTHGAQLIFSEEEERTCPVLFANVETGVVCRARPRHHNTNHLRYLLRPSWYPA